MMVTMGLLLAFFNGVTTQESLEADSNSFEDLTDITTTDRPLFEPLPPLPEMTSVQRMPGPPGFAPPPDFKEKLEFNGRVGQSVHLHYCNISYKAMLPSKSQTELRKHIRFQTIEENLDAIGNNTSFNTVGEALDRIDGASNNIRFTVEEQEKKYFLRVLSKRIEFYGNRREYIDTCIKRNRQKLKTSYKRMSIASSELLNATPLNA